MKPILFNTEMVRAILDGRKTVTRRCIKGLHQNAKFIGWKMDTGNKYAYSVATFEHNEFTTDFDSKYCINDILYVREMWSELKNSDGSHLKYVYKATDVYPFVEHGYILKFRWHPSIHMPKEAARLFLRVTDVRIERLHDIKGYETFWEGIDSGICKSQCHNDYPCYINVANNCCSAIDAFKNLWQTTVKKSKLHLYGWDVNPWVWVYEFEVISKEEAYKLDAR